MLRNLVRRAGIVAKRIGPPGTVRYRFLQRLSWMLPNSLRGNYERDPISSRLHQFAQERDEVIFVQVGAHEARAGDPISLYVRRDGWKGILVEPVPELFDRLRAYYADDEKLIFENVAISEQDGRQPLYHLDEAATEIYELADSLGSLDREVLLSHEEQVPGIARHVVEIEVDCLSFASLLDRHPLPRIDLLHIDAEGYDGRLLRTFPWHRFDPDLVLYEHDHLCRDELRSTEKMLRQRSYRLVRARTNTLADRT